MKEFIDTLFNSAALVIAVILGGAYFLFSLVNDNTKLKEQRLDTFAEQGYVQCIVLVPNYGYKILWKKECND